MAKTRAREMHAQHTREQQFPRLKAPLTRRIQRLTSWTFAREDWSCRWALSCLGRASQTPSLLCTDSSFWGRNWPTESFKTSHTLHTFLGRALSHGISTGFTYFTYLSGGGL